MECTAVQDELIAKATRQEVDLEREVVAFLGRRTRTDAYAEWLMENQVSVNTYNADVADAGLPLDAYRQF